MEEPPEAPDDQGVLTYTIKLDPFMSDLASTFLGFARYAEASALVLGKYLDMLHTQTDTECSRTGPEELRRIHRNHPENAGL